VKPELDSPILADASGYRGSADEVFFPESEDNVVAILKKASVSQTPVTISGGGSGVTGGRVPMGGWLVALEKMNRVEVGDGFAICQPGVSLRDLSAAASAAKQFYAPDPTEVSASIGGTIATNASGSRSFLYGPTRRYVRALRVVLASGEVLSLRRGDKAPFELPVVAASGARKSTAGYYLRPEMDFLDVFIGAEGTLGVVTQAELGLLPARGPLFTGVVFFESDESALQAVEGWRPVADLAMLEYLDFRSLDLLRPRFPEIPSTAKAALLIEQEIRTEGVEEAWLDRLEAAHADTEASWFATSAADRERFRKFRHTLPEIVNSTVLQRKLTKMGSDFAVPVEKNGEMLAYYRNRLEQTFPGQYVIFGHVGDAHLHVNILPATKEEWENAMNLMRDFARRAVELGGTVSAEHGLGKRKREFLELQFSPSEIEKMKSVKRRLDPQWLLGQGTLFPCPE
jgi:FAD/FMN-containing dehydrogenase